MPFSDRPLRRIATIALFAMLWLVLAPTVSHALSATRGESPWAVICTVDQARVAPARDEPVGSPVHHVFDHCPFCALQPLMAALPAAPLRLPGGERLHETPTLFLQAPSTLPAWRHALSRGPPSFS